MSSISIPSLYIKSDMTNLALYEAAERGQQSPQFGDLEKWSQDALERPGAGPKKAALRRLEVLELDTARARALQAVEAEPASRFLGQDVLQRLMTPLYFEDGWPARQELIHALRETTRLLDDVAQDAQRSPKELRHPERHAGNNGRGAFGNRCEAVSAR